MDFQKRIEHDEITGCWLWKGAPGTGGYGFVKIGGRPRRAHRVSYEWHVGPIPKGLFVLHHCDIPLCVNPNHLFLGTQADNVRDRDQKGRQARGLKQHLAQLTPKIVRKIRDSTEMGIVLAERYGVSATTISKARRGLTWRHI